jgi:DNA invertase Pin-like site-specific DNA recombinase
MTTIGYARVSTDGQTLQAQTEALHGAGCARIFAEKISGAYSDRPQLAKALAALGEGDTLIVTKLDRLARSTPICSTLSMQLAKLAQHSARWRISGRIRPRLTVA